MTIYWKQLGLASVVTVGNPSANVVEWLGNVSCSCTGGDTDLNDNVSEAMYDVINTGRSFAC